MPIVFLQVYEFNVEKLEFANNQIRKYLLIANNKFLGIIVDLQ